jgi:K+-transporting ATPase KdpF subunit
MVGVGLASWVRHWQSGWHGAACATLISFTSRACCSYVCCPDDSLADGRWPGRLLALLQVDRFFRQHLTPARRAMMLALFLLAVAVFGYLVYVLLKPEKF